MAEPDTDLAVTLIAPPEDLVTEKVEVVPVVVERVSL